MDLWRRDEPNADDLHGLSHHPMRFVAILGMSKVSAQLLPEATDEVKGLALLEACKHGHMQIITQTLAAGAAVDFSWCGTPAFWAAFHGRAEVLQLLINVRAHLDKPVEPGSTARPYLEAVATVRSADGAALAAHGGGSEGKAPDGLGVGLPRD